MDQTDSADIDANQSAGAGFEAAPRATGNMQASLQSCGHTVHRDCLASYRAAVMTHEDADNLLYYAGGEFACPVCRQLCNCAMPIFGAWGPSSSSNAADEAALVEFLETVQTRVSIPIR
eukprot:SAG11_NODE_20276_length_449_cov_0.728571_1_plen_119_part_00